MKPVKLQFKGINSFSEQTEIDFEKLSKNGIFGIFGDTGSGKSTILDCINFALYGRVERSKEKLDIINYRSECAEVKFEFDVLTEGKRKKFTVERTIRKKSGTHKATLYEDGLCVADNASTVTKKITDILGVDAEDFRKCIALPQGEFAQFVKSQPSERIKLIERLFSLYRYGDGLNTRIKERESEAELTYRTLSAKLDTYADVDGRTVKSLNEDILSCKNQIATLEKELLKAEKNYTQLKALSEKRAELDETVKNIERLTADKPRIDELRSSLKIAPVCKAVVETDAEIAETNKRLCLLDKQINDLQLKAEKENNNLTALNDKLQNGNFDENISDCITLSAKYQACEGKPEKLLKLERELESKRREYRLKDEELTKLKSRLKQAEEEVAEAEKKLALCASKDYDRLINVIFKGAVLKEEYVYCLDYFVGLNGQVKFFKDNSELYSFISRELKQQIECYRDRVLQVKDFNLEDAQNQLRNILSVDQLREKLSKELNEKVVAMKDVSAAVDRCKRETEIILGDGKKTKEQCDELEAELAKVFGIEKNYAVAVKTNSEKLEKLKEQKAKLNFDIERTNKTVTDISTNLAASRTEIKTVYKDAEKLNKKLNELLLQTGLKDVETCKRLLDDFSKYPDSQAAIDEYDSKIISLTARKNELEKIEGINGFSIDCLQAAEDSRRSAGDGLSAAREKLAVSESDLKKANVRLEEKNQLQKQLNTAEKSRGLIAQLKELTKGNKFMEYLANEYLYDISSIASSTLLNLTDGRYFLTYTDNFYAGDNFNCGNLRGVNTLSGGETFLVALSLALALSQTICSSLKSIEFFFLDEGFGTLDATLVDTVMNALEKLKSSRFTIGVISHVEELKHRIDNKITVNKATESRGSTVSLSC